MIWSLKRRLRSRDASGCGFVLMQGLIIAVLLLLNALLVRAFLVANVDDTDNAQIVQAAQFVLPLLMIFAEFWLFDFLTARSGGTSDE